MKSTAAEVAATIVHACNVRNSDVSNLKLQKFLYYCEAWHLALNDESLFLEALEAWVHGPVVAKVFHDYKNNRWSPIREANTEPSDNSEVLEHVDLVLDAYGSFGATELERLTHQEHPWLEARGGLPPDAPSRNPISRRTMKEYYSSLIA
ncbi:MAG: Panacea domain-containing protein [Bryobacteraceae bacterium]